MGNNDTARSMFDPRKHYTSILMQQGRLITDFDSNDGELIEGEERRRAQLDIIGSYGSPDDGFRIDNARSVSGFLEFDILPGTLYLGGLRLESEILQTLQTQRDHLQADPIPAGQPNRRDVVLLEVYQAPVTAVEDGELLDPAIGVDTSARLRRFQRVHVFTNVGARTCDQAWQLLEQGLIATNAGTIGTDCRQNVNTRLKVTYTEEGTDDDLCEPPLTGGYLGAENQAIRVQIVGAGKLVWGYDNAAPLYRISLSADRTRVTLITPPRDLYSTPAVGQVIEILPWGAVLSNGEKSAALSGHLTRITAVDPSDEMAGGAITLTLADPVPTNGFDEWKNRPDAAVLGADGTYLFMHIWNRGGDVTSPPAVPFTLDDPVTLGTTGIQVTISGTDAVRDHYWIIAARPETPTQVLPWELEINAAPEGIYRYFAPLAVIRWKADGTPVISDCRPPFRPLTAIDGCCTYSVGDGKTSDGDYNDLNMALQRLGENGGEICLLPGVHRADVNLISRRNITISGCGSRSKLIPSKAAGGAVINIQNCAGIGLFNFEVVSVDGTGIAADAVSGLRIEDMKVLAYKVGIDAADGEDITIRRCVIRMLDKEGGDVGIYAHGDRVVIEDCDVQVIPGGRDLPKPPDDDDDDTPKPDPTDPCAEPEDFYANLLYLIYYVDVMWGISTLYFKPKAPYLTLGGIQIGSGSEEVFIRRNEITGGAGNGITLGSDIADLDADEIQPPDDEELPTVTVVHNADLVRGQVLLDKEKPVGGMSITFDDGRGAVFTYPVNSDGYFEDKLPPGEYTVSVNDPDYGVVGIEPLGDGEYYVLVEEREVRPQPQRGGMDLLAFIHQVTIEYNRIANMGFCGIGSPRFTSADAADLVRSSLANRKGANLRLMLLVYLATGTVTGFVVDLTIYRNTITRCLQFAPLNNPDQFVIERALAGIWVALVDGVNVEENVIEDCGQGAEIPVCGLFLSFSIDVTVRENHILNNGQDRRAERLVDDFVSAVKEDAQPDTVEADRDKVGGMHSRAEYRTNTKAYNAYRLNMVNAGHVAGGNFTHVDPQAQIDFERGPRAAILLPVCMSSNVFAGGTSRITENLSLQGLTSSAEGRHAARISGNYVVQPFGKTLFVGAAGSVSVTDNQLISDMALPRQLDAGAGGWGGLIASALVFGTVDLFASNAMILNVCPGSYIVDVLRTIGKDDVVAERGFEPTPIPFGFPDGNVLFAGNQIKQGNAGDRLTNVSVFTMDDVNFVDNQIDVMNAANLTVTAVVFGATARAANNRMKEPIYLAYSGLNQKIQRFSLVEVGLFAGGMVNNQGHYCFRLFTSFGNGSEFANIGLLAAVMGCGGDNVNQQLPEVLNAVMLRLLAFSANIAMAMSGMSD